MGMAMPAAPVATPTPFIKMIRVITGRKVKCAVCGRLLEDVVYEEVPETMKDKFYDDGTHGDEVANDGTYTNIVEVNDVIGPECRPLLFRLVNLLSGSDDLGPLGFFRLFVMTDEPVSTVPKSIGVEEDLDTKLESWAGVFLRMFRKNKDDVYSEYYNLYVPPPPMKPKYPVPPGFNPIEAEQREKAGQAQQQRGGMMGPEGPMGSGEVMGEPGAGRAGGYYKI